MASSWIERCPTADGRPRYRVRYQLGGSGARKRYGGSFPTMKEAQLRKQWIDGELAARRVPEFDWTIEGPTSAPTFKQAADRWLAARIDVSEGTSWARARALSVT